MSRYREVLEEYLKTLNIKADRVLDVGGASNPVKSRVKSWEVDECKIADSGLEDGEYDIGMDLNTIDIVNLNLLSNFNIIFCLEVMEYI